MKFFLFALSVLMLVSCGNTEKTASENVTESETAQEKPQIPNLDDIKGKWVDVPGTDGQVQVMIEKVRRNLLPDTTGNLLIDYKIKNNSNEPFFVVRNRWKLTDAEGIEIDEVGEWEPMFGWGVGSFCFTTVDPKSGIRKTAGYNVQPGEVYGVSINGEYLCLTRMPDLQDYGH